MKKIFPIFIFLILLGLPAIVYLKTMAPVVQFIDSGELAVASYTLGIAHPTGYPLYTIIGRLFTLLPVEDVIFRVNLFSMLCCLGTLLFLFLTLFKLSRSFRSGENNHSTNYLLALAGSLLFAFSPVFWDQATTNEVYALGILFFTLILYLTTSWIFSYRLQNSFKAEKIFYLIVFFYGLSLTNHMSITLLAPVLLTLFIIVLKTKIFQVKRILLSLFLFILGLSVYIYLPLRSHLEPFLNWGNPANWLFFKKHVTGWQYQIWMFTSTLKELEKNLIHFLQLWSGQFLFYIFPFLALGVFYLFKKNKKLFIFSVLIFLISLIYNINYSIPDIEPYYLQSFQVSLIWIFCGFYFLAEILIKFIRRIALPILLAVFLATALVSLWKNYSREDKSQNYYAYDYAKNLLRCVGRDALIITNQWDFYAPWLYLRYIENLRPDVQVVDKKLLRMSWYTDYIKENYLDLYLLCQPEFIDFRVSVRKFEYDLEYDAAAVEMNFQRMFFCLLTKNYQIRPTYDHLFVESDVEKYFAKIPEGLVYHLQDRIDFFPYNLPALELRGFKHKNKITDFRARNFLSHYSFMLRNRSLYLQYVNRSDLAAAYLALADSLQIK